MLKLVGPGVQIEERLAGFPQLMIIYNDSRVDFHSSDRISGALNLEVLDDHGSFISLPALDDYGVLHQIMADRRLQIVRQFQSVKFGVFLESLHQGIVCTFLL